MQPQIVLLYGRPGVGKFTVGQALAAQTGYRLLHNHAVVDLVAALFPFGTPPFVVLRERLWLAAVEAALAAELPGLVLTFAPERSVTDDFLPHLAEQTTAGGGELRRIELRCAPATLEQRLGDPSRRRFGKLRDPAQYAELEQAGVFERPVMPPAELVVETDVVAPEEAARRIQRFLTREADAPAT